MMDDSVFDDDCNVSDAEWYVRRMWTPSLREQKFSSHTQKTAQMKRECQASQRTDRTLNICMRSE